jgi:DNA-binding beta-propeller fold protein YncE
VAVDQATDTIYVANGDNANGPNAGGNTVSVIDGRRCNARDVSRCKGPWPTVKVGNLPASITVDQATDTIYVTILTSNKVAVFNGATCDSQVTWGCHQPPAHVRVGSGPFGIVADDANHTVYVTNAGLTSPGDTMSMINTLTCNGSHLGGCALQKPPTVDVGPNPGGVDVAQATHTVYVGFGNGSTVGGVAAFDARTCNAIVLSGCGRIGKLTVPHVPFVPAVSVDSANNTIYATDFTNTIAVFDGRTCDATDLGGCAAQKPGVVTVAPNQFFEVAFWLVVDGPLHTVFVVNQKDDTLSAVNTNVCNGQHLPACATLQPPTIHTGEDPESVAVNTGTQTLYTANQVTNDVSVIDAATCNATNTRGCRQPPPAITLPGPGNLTADPAVATLYDANGTNTVAMINTRACNAHHRHGCTLAPPTITVGAFPQAVAVNPQTHTVYITNHGAGNTGTVTVLNERTCNATTSGCADARTLEVPGGNPAAIAINPATDTLYVATAPPSDGGLGKPSTISVFNAATCNATNNSGCGQAPHSVTVGYGAGAIAINAATDTIYVANSAGHNLTEAGNTVSVIDGNTCNATITTGCGNPPPTITLGPVFTNPSGVAIDQATDTIYVANLQNGEGSGTVSVINGATCNATTTTGCGHTPPTVTVGFGPANIAFDPANRIVAVTNVEDTSVSVINAATCNAIITTSCHGTQPRFPVGRAPGPVAIDPSAGTIYTSNGDNTISIIPATR